MIRTYCLSAIYSKSPELSIVMFLISFGYLLHMIRFMSIIQINTDL